MTFAARIGRSRQPAEPETVALYVADLKRRGRRPNNYQFLAAGATLKIAGSSVTGINQTAFDATWSVTDKDGALRVLFYHTFR